MQKSINFASDAQMYVISLTKLSVNINKIATLRNSRGGNLPNVVFAAQEAERFGAQGITVHPRPDERHIRYQDVYDLKSVVKTEFNIEGNPLEKKFVDLVLDVCPTQVTLVPDSTQQLTSDHGWDTIKNRELLTDLIQEFKSKNIRTSLFVNPSTEMVEGAAKCGADRVELYTEFYAANFANNKIAAIKEYKTAAQCAKSINIGLNAGHDLNLDNLTFFKKEIDNLLEVSIGHALISDAIYLGFENTIQLYLQRLK